MKAELQINICRANHFDHFFLHRHTQKKKCCCYLCKSRKVLGEFLHVREAAVHTRIVVFCNDSFSAWLTAVVAIAKLWAKGSEGHR